MTFFFYLLFQFLVLLLSNLRITVLSVETEDITVDPNDYFYTVSECIAPIICWTAPSTYRFSSTTENENPFATASRSGLRLSAAANEFEAFQIALKSTSADLQVTAELYDFQPSLGSANDRRMHVYKVSYHSTLNLADSLTRIVDESAFTVPAASSEPATVLFVRIYVPQDATAGEYTTNLVLTHSSTMINIPITLTVFGFQLPVQATFKTQLNLSVQKLKPSFLSDEMDKLDWAKQFLLEYRMTPKGVAWPSGLTPGITWDNSDSPSRCTAYYDEGDVNLPYSAVKNTNRWVYGQDWTLRRWMVDANDVSCTDSTNCPASTRNNNTGFSSNMLFQFPSNSEPRPSTFCDISIGADNFGSEAYNTEWLEFLSALNEYAKSNGLTDKSYVYVQNEPQNDEDARLANFLCHMYKTAAPDLKIAISEEAKANIADRTDTEGPCGYDIWIAHVPAFDREYAWQRMKQGEESWVYSLPQDSGALFSPCENDIGVNDGMNIRVIPWAAFKARIRGWAYYQFDIFFEDSLPMQPKIGAEIFRDAMEDYEYLYLANGGKHPMPNVAEQVDPIADSIGFSFTAWLRDHAKFAALRHELGRFIEGSRSTLATLPKNQGVSDAIYINFQDPTGDPLVNPLVIDGNTYLKIGWEPFDVAKGYGWSGFNFNDDGSPNLSILLYNHVSGGTNALEESYIYNDFGRENVFDYAVADGTWTVTVAVGIPNQSRSDIQDVTVNGVIFNDQAVSSVQYFTKEVVVNDGYLSIAFGKTFDEYCFISHFKAIPKDLTVTQTTGPRSTPEPKSTVVPTSVVSTFTPTPSPSGPEECGPIKSILRLIFGWFFRLFGFYFCET